MAGKCGGGNAAFEVSALQAANCVHGALIVEHDFGDERRYDPDAVLAGVMALDDVGVANYLFDLILESVDSCAALLQKR